MPRPVEVSLTVDEATELFIAAVGAMADEEFTTSGADAAALANAIDKLAAMRPVPCVRVRSVAYKVMVVAVLTTAGFFGVPALADKPAIASPFDDGLLRTAYAAVGVVHCDEAAPRRIRCDTKDGLSLRIEAYEGPECNVFIVTYREAGVMQRNEFRVYNNPDALNRLTAAAASMPQAYPNLYTGPNWSMQGSDGVRLARAATALEQRTRAADKPTR